jgi:hypothetical protein
MRRSVQAQSSFLFPKHSYPSLTVFSPGDIILQPSLRLHLQLLSPPLELYIQPIPYAIVPLKFSLKPVLFPPFSSPILEFSSRQHSFRGIFDQVEYSDRRQSKSFNSS